MLHDGLSLVYACHTTTTTVIEFTSSGSGVNDIAISKPAVFRVAAYCIQLVLQLAAPRAVSLQTLADVWHGVVGDHLQLTVLCRATTVQHSSSTAHRVGRPTQAPACVVWWFSVGDAYLYCTVCSAVYDTY